MKTMMLDEGTAADVLDETRRTMQAMRQSGRGPRYVKMTRGQSGRVKYSVDALAEFLAEREVQSTAQASDGAVQASATVIARFRAEIEKFLADRERQSTVHASAA